MRLWQKIFLTTLILMVASTTAASMLILQGSRDALWQREGQRAVTQQQYLAGLLRAGVISHRLQLGLVQLEETEAKQTAAEVLAQQGTDSYLSGFVLLDESGGRLVDTMPEGLGQLPTAPEEEPEATVYELRPGKGCAGIRSHPAGHRRTYGDPGRGAGGAVAEGVRAAEGVFTASGSGLEPGSAAGNGVGL